MLISVLFLCLCLKSALAKEVGLFYLLPDILQEIHTLQKEQKELKKLCEQPRRKLVELQEYFEEENNAGVTTAIPALCKEGWTNWINRDKPDTGSGDHEFLSPGQLAQFCPNGKINGADCATSSGIPAFASGDVMSCTTENGAFCKNADNARTLLPCRDYKIKYHCICDETPNRDLLPLNPELSVVTQTPLPKHMASKRHLLQCIPENCPANVLPMVKQGEVVRTVVDSAGCCSYYEVFCKPDTCAPPTLMCPSPRMIQPESPYECCPTYRCMCPPVCPQMKQPHCGKDQEVIQVSAECNCTAYVCVDKSRLTITPASKTCKYRSAVTTNRTQPIETIYQIGATWSDGVCKTCTCDEHAGRAETSCKVEQCPTCPLSYQMQTSADRCCGPCKQIGCYVNGTIYKDEQTIPASRQCYTRQCSFDSSLKMFIISEIHITCPSYEKLLTCAQNETSTDSFGCCMTCIPSIKIRAAVPTCPSCYPRPVFSDPRNSIGYFEVMDSMELCWNHDPILDFRECSGSCHSLSIYSTTQFGFSNKCCQSTSSQTIPVRLTSKSGRTINRTYSNPTSCGYNTCSGEKQTN